ncbi:MAG: signal recognition particle-docking protein FtsY [Gammaproteobacteria bacterium]|nr:signal recognition particle-docking protein FtsY [Gammaproteobacteria bacterium]
MADPTPPNDSPKKKWSLFSWFKSDKPEDQPAVEASAATEEVPAEAAQETVAPVEIPPEPPAEEPLPEAPVPLEPAPVMEAEAPAAAESQPEAGPVPAEPEPVASIEALQPETRDKPSLFARLKAGLSRTRANLAEGLASLVLGKKAIDDELLEELETQLLTADVGVEATSAIIADLTRKVARKELADADALMNHLKGDMKALLAPVTAPLVIDGAKKPHVILMVGVNGVGKTTTIGKLASRFKAEGKTVMLAAGDTFRAAAVEQLQVWGQRNAIPVIAQHTGADSASVLFDALQAAQARGADVLIADTAGRLHTKDNLMEELKKIVRVMQKLDATAPHEVMLVLDAGTGQNALNQAAQFHAAVPLTGLTLTKLDGTAKGGVVFAIAKRLNVPIRYIGVGEGIADLRDFDGEDFVEALFARDGE